MKIAVIGAGIVGLAAAKSLLALGHEVRCFEADSPMGARSAGDTRVFRLSHADPALIDWAVQARAAWRAWSTEFGESLLQQSGQLGATADMESRLAVMHSLDVPAEIVTNTTLLTPITSQSIDEALLHDPWAGAVQAAATGRYLVAIAHDALVHDAVEAIEITDDGGVTIHARSEDWHCDAALIAAGQHSPTLAATCGIAVSAVHEHAARFTFRMDDPEGIAPNWFETYDKWDMWGLTVRPGHWAMGIHWDGEPGNPTISQAASNAARLHELQQYISQRLDRIDPTPVDTIACVGDAGGDGVHAARRGPVLTIWGDNLLKFAPVLGPALAKAAAKGDRPEMPLLSWSE